MTNDIYSYSQTSCRCNSCNMNKVNYNGIPTNMSVPDCNFNKYNECYTKGEFRDSNIEPEDKAGYLYLNSKALYYDIPDDFNKIECPNNLIGCKTLYASTDPRLINRFTGQVLKLDRPPEDDNMKLDNISSTKYLDNYGKGYRSYSDITAGQVQYYIDKSIEGPFFNPLFSNSANVNSSVYKDPMGSLKPEYIRTPLTCNPLNTLNKNYSGGLSSIQDSNEHREDLLSKQMWQSNQQKWSSRWPSSGYNL